ncbi:MAG: hypothetical protein JHC26_09625 [Thermofilum sp.]|uniref:hypothetical protein n=1 Tax=Thermofilum sp. TaxID=1961369 RepID=UPI00258981B3|nr:hypothetical protein [Thermofilum sp.]MCI4409340.1 hypothetical protein [Thermofilum sp.]
MSKAWEIEEKVIQTVKKLTEKPIEVGDFLSRFETETGGWTYTIDSRPKVLDEEVVDINEDIVRETRECIDEVRAGDEAIVTVIARETWEFREGREYILNIDIKYIEAEILDPMEIFVKKLNWYLKDEYPDVLRVLKKKPRYYELGYKLYMEYGFLTTVIILLSMIGTTEEKNRANKRRRTRRE